MKNFILTIAVVFPLLLHAQLYEWMPNTPLTDSSHQNRNACLWVDDFSSQKIMFWEQETDANTSQLCYREIDPLGDEHIALSQPGIKLTNPESFGNKIIYQTNEGNDIDLKFITYNLDGTFSAPQLLADNHGDDINLVTDQYSLVAWENNGRIWISQFDFQNNSFTSPFAIDSLGAYSPAFIKQDLCYLRLNGDSTEKINANVNYSLGAWDIIYKETTSYFGVCTSLTSTPTFMGIAVFAMENHILSNPTGLIFSGSWYPQIEYLNSSNFNYSQPSIKEYVIGVKGGEYFLSFVSDSLSQQEVFAQEPYLSPINISKWPGNDQNPKFFESYPNSYIIRVHLLWESERQGFSTIYRSYYDYLFGGTEENPKAETLKVNPCPFSTETKIAFQSIEKTQFVIYDMQGREIKSLTPVKDDEGWQKSVWNGTNYQGNTISSGNYMVVAVSGKSRESRIIIKD